MGFGNSALAHLLSVLMWPLGSQFLGLVLQRASFEIPCVVLLIMRKLWPKQICV